MIVLKSGYLKTYALLDIGANITSIEVNALFASDPEGNILKKLSVLKQVSKNLFSFIENPSAVQQ